MLLEVNLLKVSVKKEKKNHFFAYQKSTILETSLRRAYGRDVIDSLSKNVDSLQTQELEFEGEKYLVRKVDGEFNRMVSLLGAIVNHQLLMVICMIDGIPVKWLVTMLYAIV